MRDLFQVVYDLKKKDVEKNKYSTFDNGTSGSKKVIVVLFYMEICNIQFIFILFRITKTEWGTANSLVPWIVLIKCWL